MRTATAGPQHRRPQSARAVGRERELRVLAQALEEAADGRPGMALVSGEAGIGKTRLVTELERMALAGGGRVLRGGCVRLGGSDLPYAPMVAALRGVPDDNVRELCRRLPAEAAAELAPLLPARTLSGRGASSGDAGGGQSRLFELLLRFLGDLAEDRPPLVVALEDLHWADVSTLDVVAYLARNLAFEPLLLVLTRRDDARRGDDALDALLAELRREPLVWRLDVAPLREDETRELLAELCDSPPSPQFVTEVHARAGGNPFFVEELAAAGHGASLPSDLRDALLTEVTGISPAAAALVRAAAVLGSPTSSSVLGAVAALVEPVLSAALREALDHYVLVRSPDLGDFDFRHALVREAVYDDLLAGERIAQHAAAATVLERHGAPSAEVAFHLLASGNTQGGVAATVAAGRDAARVHAFADAHDHFERALEAWPEDGGMTTADRIDVLSQAADAARCTGDYERARDRCREALALLDARSEPARAALLHERLGEYLFPDEEASLRAYSQALELMPRSMAIERSRVLAAEARAFAGLLRWPKAAERSVESIAALGTRDAPAEAAAAHSMLGLCRAFLGDPENGHAHAREAVAAAERAQRGDEIARAHLVLAEVLRLDGRTEEAHADMVRARREADRFGVAGSFGRFMLVAAADDLFALGRWHEAARLLEEAAGIDLGPVGTLLYHAVAAQLAALRGDRALAKAHLAAVAADHGDSHPEYAPAIAAAAMELALSEGEIVVARKHLEVALAAVGGRQDPLNTPVLYSMGTRAEADAAAVGGPDSVDALLGADALITALEAIVVEHTGVAEPAVGAAHLALCRAERARAARAATGEEWAAAAERFARMGHRFTVAYARWREAEAILTGGGRHGAESALRAAHVTAVELAARPLASEIERLARRARLQLLPPPEATTTDAPRSSAARDLGLTGREIEVLQLMAAGRTNREIAELLFISHRTAGVHVSRILAKLDAGNRVEAAGRAFRLGLVPDSDGLQGSG